MVVGEARLHGGVPAGKRDAAIAVVGDEVERPGQLSERVAGDQSKRDVYTVKFRTELRGITAIRLEVLPDESLPRNGPGRTFYEGARKLQSVQVSVRDTSSSAWRAVRNVVLTYDPTAILCNRARVFEAKP